MTIVSVASEDHGNGDPEGNEDEPEEEEDDLDEVIGYHFMECTTLFVSYIYVNSGTLTPSFICLLLK